MFFRGPGVPGVLRAANARLRGLLAERGAEIAVLREQLAALQAQVEGLAAQDVMEFIRFLLRACPVSRAAGCPRLPDQSLWSNLSPT